MNGPSVTELEASIVASWAQVEGLDVLIQQRAVLAEDEELFKETLFSLFRLGYSLGLTHWRQGED